MKLFTIIAEGLGAYDVYEGAVVAAIDENDARTIHPNEDYTVIDGEFKREWESINTINGTVKRHYMKCHYWVKYADIDKLKVVYIGETKLKRGVVLASYQAG